MNILVALNDREVRLFLLLNIFFVIFQTLKINDLLKPDIESIESAWNKLEQTINQIETNLNKSKKFKIDLDLIEYELTNIELKVCEKQNIYLEIFFCFCCFSLNNPIIYQQ